MEENKLLKLSLENFGKGYEIPTILEDIKHEETIFIQEEYTISERYNQTKIIFLPVDPSNHFIYWDIEDKLYQQIKSNPLEIKIFVSNAEKKSISVDKQWGKLYFSLYAPFEEAFCLLGYIENGDFVQVAVSNKFILPSDTLFEGEEIFLRREELQDEKKAKKLLKRIKSSNPSEKLETQNTGSSEKYIK